MVIYKNLGNASSFQENAWKILSSNTNLLAKSSNYRCVVDSVSKSEN